MPWAGGKPFPSLHKASPEQASAALAAECRQQPQDRGDAEELWQTLALTQAQAGHAQPRLPKVPGRQRPVRKTARKPQNAISCIRVPPSVPSAWAGSTGGDPWSPSLVPISIPIPAWGGPAARVLPQPIKRPSQARHAAAHQRHGQHRRSDAVSCTQNNCRARQGNREWQQAVASLKRLPVTRPGCPAPATALPALGDRAGAGGDGTAAVRPGASHMCHELCPFSAERHRGAHGERVLGSRAASQRNGAPLKIWPTRGAREQLSGRGPGWQTPSPW